MSDLIDALTGALIEDPVMAEDGQIYDRSTLMEFFKARRAEGEHIVSPQDGRTPMRAQTHEAPKAVEALRPAAGAAVARLRPGVEAAWARSGGAEAWRALPAAARSAAPYTGVALVGAVAGLSVARRGAERRFRKERAALQKRVSELESTQHPLLH